MPEVKKILVAVDAQSHLTLDLEHVNLFSFVSYLI